MTKLIILRGISGSGKSTTANVIRHDKDKCIVVNRDKIRELLFGSEDAFGVDEELVTKIEHHTLASAIGAGYDVVSDNTNIRWEFVRKIARVAVNADPAVDVEIILIDTPLEEAITRNNNRERKVPEHVIRNQHAQLETSKDWTL